MQSKDIKVGDIYAVHIAYSIPRDAMFSQYGTGDINKMKVVEIIERNSYSNYRDLDAVRIGGEDHEPSNSRYATKLDRAVVVEFTKAPNSRMSSYQKGDRIAVAPRRVLALFKEYQATRKQLAESQAEADRERKQRVRDNTAKAKLLNERQVKAGLVATGYTGKREPLMGFSVDSHSGDLYFSKPTLSDIEEVLDRLDGGAA